MAKKLNEPKMETQEEEDDKMQIELFEGYYITSDKYQFILNKRGWTSKGTRKVDTEGYFGTMQSLIKYIINVELRKSKVKDLKSLNDKMDDLEKQINKLFPEFKVTHKG